MKKIISIILALVLCLSLCACGKSAEAKAADELILAIGEVSADSAYAVEAATEAYNALSDKDRETVENYEILKNAQEELFYIELYDLSNRLLEVYYNCQRVTAGTRIIWSNVGNSNFWTCYEAVRNLDMGLTRTEYNELFKELYGANAYATIWCAARGLCPDNVYDTNKMTDEGQDDTIELCHAFNACFELISENMAPLSEEVRVFKNKYKADYEEESETLNEISLEIDMYVDFALEPAGSLSSYTSTEDEYNNTIDRLVKILDSYR